MEIPHPGKIAGTIEQEVGERGERRVTEGLEVRVHGPPKDGREPFVQPGKGYTG